MSNSSVFKVRLKVLRSSADRHLHDSEFQVEGVLTVNAFAGNATVIFGDGDPLIWNSMLPTTLRDVSISTNSFSKHL